MPRHRDSAVQLWQALSGQAPETMEHLLSEHPKPVETRAVAESQQRVRIAWNGDMVEKFVTESRGHLEEDPPSEVWGEHLKVKIAENEVRQQCQRQQHVAQALPEAGVSGEVLAVFDSAGPYTLTELDERIGQRDAAVTEALQSAHTAHVARMTAKDAFFKAYFSRHNVCSHV